MADRQTSLDELKDELGRAASSPETDFDGILRIAGEIAKRQEGVVRFAADAALVRRLGRELVAKQETALGELVKNAYDADATGCEISLAEGACGPRIDIVDDGNGMSYAEIANGFMRLASDQKVVNPVSPRFGRSRAGKKGIGRFATERIGTQLTIVTQTEAETHGWTLKIDWSGFEQGMDIGIVANSIARTDKERPHGTRLSMSGLHDQWNDADLRRVYRYLATLIQPVVEGLEPAQADTPRAHDEDPGFSVEIVRSGTPLDEPRVVANVDSEILGLALAVITATVGPKGNAIWGMSCPRQGISVIDEPIGLGRDGVEPFLEARDVELRAHYYILRSEFLGHSKTTIQNVLREHGGVRLFRNGYRVPPYGSKGDDWLGLDEKKGTYAPIRRDAFLGYVALHDPDGDIYEETSSREGLIERQAFDEVRDLASRVLEVAVRRIESSRGLGPKKRKLQDLAGGGQAAGEIKKAVDDVRAAIEDAQRDSADPRANRERVDGAVRRLAVATNAVVEIAQERDELLQELNLLRILASMGLTVTEFTHDFSHLAETMELNLNGLIASAGGQSPAFDQQMERFRGQFRQVRAYTSHFGSMMTSNATRELAEIDLYGFARSFEQDLAAMFSRRGLELAVERPVEYDLRTAPMHASEWSSILLNLLTNSIKAVLRTGRAGRFLIRIGRLDGNRVFLEFCDNGDGIPDANRERIFDAFFTTASGAGARASEAVQAVGTGLGLKIVADIAAAAGGDVSVAEPPEGYSTSIRVTVPGAVDATASVTGDRP